MESNCFPVFRSREKNLETVFENWNSIDDDSHQRVINVPRSIVHASSREEHA